MRLWVWQSDYERRRSEDIESFFTELIVKFIIIQEIIHIKEVILLT